MDNPYRYSPAEPRFTMRPAGSTGRWRRYLASFPVVRPTPHPESNTGLGEYYLPGRHRGPLVILLHGLGDQSIIPCRALARSLASQGIACFVLYLVYHSRRMPEKFRKGGRQPSSEEWSEAHVTSVTDVRHALDWASRLPGVNRHQIGVVGVSLGGFIATIAMGLDRRLSAGVFIASGGNYENRGWPNDGRDGQSAAMYLEAQEQYARYCAAVAERGFENVTPDKPTYLTDPVTFAPSIPPRPVLMINGRRDKYVPKRCTLDLWQACGRPDICWLPTGHAGIWLLYPLVSQRVSRFFRNAFPATEEAQSPR